MTNARKAELLAGPARIEDLANAAADESRGLLDELRIVRSVLMNQFLTAAECADRNGVATLSGRLLLALREVGRLTGELREISGITINNNTVNVLASPQFLVLQEGLLRVARSHGEARADIIELLRQIDAAPGAAPAPRTIECEAIEA